MTKLRVHGCLRTARRDRSACTGETLLMIIPITTAGAPPEWIVIELQGAHAYDGRDSAM